MHFRAKKIDDHIHLKGGYVKRPDGRKEYRSVDEMLRVFDLLDIEKGLIMPIAKSGGLGDGLVSSEEACEICEMYPDRFGWMCNISIRETDDLYGALERYKKMGALGVGELLENVRFDDPSMRKFYDCCEQLGLCILFHMSPEVNTFYGVADDAGLPGLEAVLKAYPNLTLIGHGQPFWVEIGQYEPGERNNYPVGPVRKGRLYTLLKEYPNLYGDLSANSGGNALMRDPENGVAFLTEFQDKLFFGSDHATIGDQPAYEGFDRMMIYPLSAWLDSLYFTKRIDASVFNKIVRENAQRVIGL